MSAPSPSTMWLSIPSELGAVRLLGAALQSVLRELDCDAELASRVELCVVEGVNNAIEHAYDLQPGHRIEVELAVERDQLHLEIADQGRLMPESAMARARAAAAGDAEPTIDDPMALAEGGYGLRLIVSMMDAVSYRQVDDRNVLAMTTALHRRSA